MWFMFQHFSNAAIYVFLRCLDFAGLYFNRINNVQNSFTLLLYTFPVIFLNEFFLSCLQVKKNLMSWANNTFPNLRTDVYCKPFWCCYMIDCRFLQCQRFWILTSKMFFMASIFGGMQHWSVATYLKWAMCFVSKHPYANNNERK